jgi:hypothetical protein
MSPSSSASSLAPPTTVVVYDSATHGQMSEEEQVSECVVDHVRRCCTGETGRGGVGGGERWCRLGVAACAMRIIWIGVGGELRSGWRSVMTRAFIHSPTSSIGEGHTR